MVGEKAKGNALNRLAKIKGQIEGIEKMIEGSRYCVDIVMQIASAESALHRVSEVILRNHLETCVQEAFISENDGKREEKIDELMKIYKNVRVK